MHNIAELAARRKTLLIAGVAILLGAALLGWSALSGMAAPASAQSDEAPLALDTALEDTGDLDTAVDAPADDAVLVYVTGAVAAPDVYRLPAEARVKDLVLAAGGLSADADMQRINLAARLSDGEHVDVPQVGAEGAAEPAGASAAPGLIDINSASAGELDALPGIGPAIAERIVAHREANGPFESIEGLQDVKGVGAALFEQIAPLVTAGT